MRSRGFFIVLALSFPVLWSMEGPFAPRTAIVEGKEPQVRVENGAGQAEADQEYYELLKLFADTLDQVERNYVQDVSRRDLMEAAIRGMLSKLDQHSNYIPPDELDRFRSGVEAEFGGIGIQVSVDEGQLTIVSPLVGSPAYRAGLLAGDKIVQVDGHSTKGITLDEAIRRIKGKVGTSVELTVEHPDGGQSRTVTLTREIVRVETVLGSHRNEDDSWNFLHDPERGIGYIRLTAFSRHTTEELQKALRQLKQHEVQGLVLDLRFNPGGLLSSAIEVSDLFVSEGRIVSTAGRNAPERVWEAHQKGTYNGFPMVVLVNRYSASASEIVAACLQDHGRAVVLGERTWGKGSVQNIIELEEGRSALKLTTAGYQRPSGKNIHRFDGNNGEDEWGVKPNSGFEIKLSNDELRDLMRHRRQLDIIRKQAPQEQAPQEQVPQDEAPQEETAEEEAEPQTEFVDRQLERALAHLHKQLETDEESNQETAQASN